MNGNLIQSTHEDVNWVRASIRVPMRGRWGKGRGVCTPCEERVLDYVIAHSFTDRDGRPKYFRQRQSTIAAHLHYAVATISRAFGALVRKGLIVVRRHRRRCSDVMLAQELLVPLLRMYRALRNNGLKEYLSRRKRRKAMKDVMGRVRQTATTPYHRNSQTGNPEDPPMRSGGGGDTLSNLLASILGSRPTAAEPSYDEEARRELLRAQARALASDS